MPRLFQSIRIRPAGRFIAALAVCAMLCGGANIPHAAAQAGPTHIDETGLGAGIDSRSPAHTLPEEYKARPVLWRGFSFLPSLGVQTVYNSNIYAARDGEKSGFIARVMPGLDWTKKYDGHDFGGSLSANIERFATEKTENKEEFSARIGASLNANSRWSFPFSFLFDRASRDRIDPLRHDATEKPENIDTATAGAGIVRHFNRLTVSLNGQYSQKSYEDGISRATGAPVLFSRQDSAAAGGFLGLEYALLRGNSSTASPEHALYLNLSHLEKEYETGHILLPDGSYLKGDSHNQSVMMGFKTSYKGLLYAKIGVGALRQDFVNDPLGDTINTDYEAELAYNMTPKATWRFKAMREMDEDSDFIRGYLRSAYMLGLDYEIYHNLFWHNALEYQTYRFEDNETGDRYDYALRSDLQYFLSAGLHTGLEVQYKTRKSEDASSEFDRFIMMLKLKKNF